MFALKLHSTVLFFLLIMSRDVLISLLSKGQDGKQILQILDALTDGSVSASDSEVTDSLNLSVQPFPGA